MEKIFKLLNKKYDSHFDKHVSFKKKRNQMEETFKEFHLEYKQQNPLDFFNNEIIYTGIQQKKRIEDAFFVSQNKMNDYYFTLDYEEKQRLINVDVEMALYDLHYVSIEDTNVYVPFFDLRLNHIYQTEMVLFDIKKYRDIVYKFEDVMLKSKEYARCFYNHEFCSAQIIMEENGFIGLYCEEIKCLYFIKNNNLLNHLTIINNETSQETLKKLCELYNQSNRIEFIDALEQNQLIKEKELKKVRKYLKKGESMSTFALATLGCKVNAYESESYIHDLIALGFEEVDFKEQADIYIINTCAVTNSASSKSRQKMNQAKKRNPDAIVCLVGCFVQTDKSANELGVDVLIGSSCKHELANIVNEAFTTRESVNYVGDIKEVTTFEQVNVDHFEHKTRAFLKIQDGCNQFCSYCIIPYARGKERSLSFDEVINNAKKLVSYHHKEIVLTGIHTGRYGRDIGSDLLSLLKELVKIEGLMRIRISSIEMNEVSDELISFIMNEKKMAKHLHIPLQSGVTEF